MENFGNFKEFALNLVQPVLKDLVVETDFIEISTQYEGKKVVFTICGLRRKGRYEWGISSVYEPGVKTFERVVEYK